MHPLIQWQALPGKMEGVHLHGDDADNDEDLALRLQLAAMSFDEGVSVRLRDRSASLQSHSTVFDWSENSRTVSTRTHHFSMVSERPASRSRSFPLTMPQLQEAIPPSICQQKCIIARPIQHYTTFNPTSWKLQDMKVIYKAPGGEVQINTMLPRDLIHVFVDINTIVQNANIVVIASAVTDGASYGEIRSSSKYFNSWKRQTSLVRITGKVLWASGTDTNVSMPTIVQSMIHNHVGLIRLGLRGGWSSEESHEAFKRLVPMREFDSYDGLTRCLVYEPWHHLTVNDVAIDPNQYVDISYRVLYATVPTPPRRLQSILFYLYRER